MNRREHRADWPEACHCPPALCACTGKIVLIANPDTVSGNALQIDRFPFLVLALTAGYGYEFSSFIIDQHGILCADVFRAKLQQRIPRHMRCDPAHILQRMSIVHITQDKQLTVLAPDPQDLAKVLAGVFLLGDDPLR